MKERLKNLLAYIGIIILILILGYVTYYKYFVKEILPNQKNSSVSNQQTNNKNNIKSIKNTEDIKMEDFSLTNLKIEFDEENKIISITGNINNLTNFEKNFKIVSSLYNKDKYLINTKTISIDTKIQPKDTIPFFVNHYYSEIETKLSEITNYKLEVIE